MAKTRKQSGPWAGKLLAPITRIRRAFIPTIPDDVTGVRRVDLLTHALLSGRGEASGAVVAEQLVDAFKRLSATERVEYYLRLSRDFRADAKRLQDAARAYLKEQSLDSESALIQACEPPRQEVLRRINMAQGGTALLVGIRGELRDFLKTKPHLRALDSDLRHLFMSWFNRGFLELRRIDWHTSAAILEKLIQHEAVHEVRDWTDLRRRLAPDRRCFAFFHPALPDEPLIFVEIALTNGPGTSVRALLKGYDGQHDRDGGAVAADTATFYSISNCQVGLRGVSFGNLLIKQVVQELHAELPQIRRFATLSPVPGFRGWLTELLAHNGALDVGLSQSACAKLTRVAVDATKTLMTQHPRSAIRVIQVSALAELLHNNCWATHARARAALRPALTRLAAIYLTRSTELGSRMDPVARFHLGNGAILDRINWMANTSATGIRSSYGIMVNYLYDPATIETNHELFVRDHKIAKSKAVSALATDSAVKSILTLRSTPGSVGDKPPRR